MENKQNPFELSQRDFERFSALIYQSCGIAMNSMKYELLRARIAKRLRALGLKSFKDYFELVSGGTQPLELDRMIDVVTTNKTDFFRESGHYAHLAKHLHLNVLGGKKAPLEPLRFWSAACSSGEEPYTMAMVLHETLAGRVPFKILATDISSRMLHRAKSGLYTPERVRELPAGYLEKYFEPVSADGEPGYSAGPALREAVQFSRFNLNDANAYVFSRKFDAIFCRNVMIYFDRPTQEAMVARLSAQLADQGLLYTGFSESLIGIRHNLQSAGPSAYRKRGAWSLAS